VGDDLLVVLSDKKEKSGEKDLFFDFLIVPLYFWSKTVYDSTL